MVDRNKVIKGLEICIKYIDRDCPIGCPYHEICTKYEGRVVFQPVLIDALALLKEQEAVTEYVIDEFQPTCKACGFRPFAGYIPSLEWMRERGFRFCPQCRKEVKWE